MEEVRGKVHYIQVDADEFCDECERMKEEIGDDFVVRIIATPTTYIHAVNEDLRGITVLVVPDTPVSRTLIRDTLCTGTSEYDLSTMEDGSEIDLEKLRSLNFSFNSCVTERCPINNRFKIFSNESHNWDPTLGDDCVDAIRIAREYDSIKRSYRWKLFVTSGMDYAASELISYAIQEKWSIQQLYESENYKRLLHAANTNRNRVAFAAASSLDLRMPRSKYEMSMTAEKVNYFVPTFSSLHNTIIEKDLGKDNGGKVYALHIETYPLQAYERIPFMRGDVQMVTIFEPNGGVGKRSWNNKYASSFPSSCGLKNHEELRGILSNWDPEEAHGDQNCDKQWESVVGYNLHSMNDVHKPWQRIEPGLHEMGLNNHWKRTVLEVVMLKTASMQEERLTAFELLKTTSINGRIRVPIRSSVFRGGNGYKGLWDVFTIQDPPPASILSEYVVPGYLDIEQKYLIRIAYANGEITQVYQTDYESESEDGSESESDVSVSDDDELFEIED